MAALPPDKPCANCNEWPRYLGTEEYCTKDCKTQHEEARIKINRSIRISAEFARRLAIAQDRGWLK